MKCLLAEGSCIDMVRGYTFWDTVPLDRCGFDHYGLLFKGLAKKMYDPTPNFQQTVYLLSTEDITSALIAKGYVNIYGCLITKSEHPKFFIFETTNGKSFANRKKISVSNLDIFAYVNSKFVLKTY